MVTTSFDLDVWCCLRRTTTIETEDNVISSNTKNELEIHNNIGLMFVCGDGS
jgi:hypothetical protein